MQTNKNIALAVENGLLLEAVFDAISQLLTSEERKRIHLVNDAPQDLELPDSFDPDWHTPKLSEFDFTSAAVLILADKQAYWQEGVEKALASGCHVIDLTREWITDPRSLVLDTGALNEIQLPSSSGALIVLPSFNVLQLLAVLRPIEAVMPIESVQVAMLQPVAHYGQEGVETLARETAQILNARGQSNDLFPTQMSFNVLPASGELNTLGMTKAEADVEHWLPQLLFKPQLMVESQDIQTAVFFGCCHALTVRVDDYCDQARLTEVLGASTQLKLYESPWYEPNAVQAGEANGGISVGRMRMSRRRDDTFQLWTVGDSVVKTSTFEAIRLVQILINFVF